MADYLDDRAAEKLVRRVRLSRPDPAVMRDLCRFRTKTSEDFWERNMGEYPLYVYTYDARSDVVSDMAAKSLDSFLELTQDMTAPEPWMAERAYQLANFCTFKQSPAMINAYRRMARDYKRLRRLDIRVDTLDSYPEDAPDWIRERYSLDRDNCSEGAFLDYLTDRMIFTAADAFSTYGRHQDFTAEIKELCEDYPDAFAPAGLFIHMIEDSHSAYDMYKPLTEDISRYPELLYVIGGLEERKGKIFQYTPEIFTGPDNQKSRVGIFLKDFDHRWIDFLCAAPYRVRESCRTVHPRLTDAAFRRFSLILVHCLFVDEPDESICEYFARSLTDGGTYFDILGAKLVRAVGGAEDFRETAVLMAQRISENVLGIQSLYELYRLMGTDEHPGTLLTAGEMLPGMTAALEILRENGYADREPKSFCEYETFVGEIEK